MQRQSSTKTGKRQQIPIRRADGRVIGTLAGGVLALRRDPARHLLRECPDHARPCWALDLGAAQLALTLGGSGVVVVITSTVDGSTWRAALSELLDHGERVTFHPFGAQVALHLDLWRHDPAHDHAASTTTTTADPQQMTLFTAVTQ